MRRTRITRLRAGSSPIVGSEPRSFRSASSIFPKFWSRPRRIHRASGGRGPRSRRWASRSSSRRRRWVSMPPVSVRRTRSAFRMRTAWPRLGMGALPWLLSTRRSFAPRRLSRYRSPIDLRPRHEHPDLDAAVANWIESCPRYRKGPPCAGLFDSGGGHRPSSPNTLAFCGSRRPSELLPVKPLLRRWRRGGGAGRRAARRASRWR
jgi:hypothetical protein